MEERREYQRLNLTKPLDAWFGDFAVQLVEVSASGASMLHEEELPDGARAPLVAVRYDPTPEQVRSAIVGGNVTVAGGRTVLLRGVLEGRTHPTAVAPPAQTSASRREGNLSDSPASGRTSDTPRTGHTSDSLGTGHTSDSSSTGQTSDRPSTGFTSNSPARR